MANHKTIGLAFQIRYLIGIKLCHPNKLFILCID